MTDVAFLHGGGQGGWVWDETIAEMARQSGGTVRCLALDGPGCGTRRGRDTTQISFADITRELVADLVAAGMDDVVLVGHSQAGVHLPAMAMEAPELFRKLVFVSCSAPDEGLTLAEMTGQRLHPDGHPFSDASLPVRERYRAMFCNDMAAAQAEAFLDRLGPDSWPAACYAMRSWPRDHIAGFDCSYIVCTEDAILPAVWQERFADRLHARRVHRIAAGHQVMNTRPGELAALLLAEAAG